MPTLLSCLWMISNVRARSGLPDVVVKANDNCPTPGQLKILLVAGVRRVRTTRAAVLLQQRDHVALAELPPFVRRLVRSLEGLVDVALQDRHLLVAR